MSEEAGGVGGAGAGRAGAQPANASSAAPAINSDRIMPVAYGDHGRSQTSRIFPRPAAGAARAALPPGGASELRPARGPRVGDDVSDVLHAGDVHEHALEAQAEARVRGRTEFSKLEVPPVGGLRQALFADALEEHVVTLLALAAADDLSNPRRQHVH